MGEGGRDMAQAEAAEQSLMASLGPVAHAASVIVDEDVCVFKCSVSRETECSRVGKQSFIITLGCNSVLIQFATPNGTIPLPPRGPGPCSLLPEPRPLEEAVRVWAGPSRHWRMGRTRGWGGRSAEKPPEGAEQTRVRDTSGHMRLRRGWRAPGERCWWHGAGAAVGAVGRPGLETPEGT